MLYPTKAEKKASKQQTVAVCCVYCHSSGARRWLLVQRPASGLLANLWEFPTVHVEPTDSGESRRAALLQYMEQLGVEAVVQDGAALMARAVSCGELKHTFSHIDQQLHVDSLCVSTEELGGVAPGPQRRWLRDDEVRAAAVPTQMKKVFRAAMAQLSPPTSTQTVSKKRKASLGGEPTEPKMAAMMQQFLFRTKKPNNVKAAT